MAHRSRINYCNPHVTLTLHNTLKEEVVADAILICVVGIHVELKSVMQLYSKVLKVASCSDCCKYHAVRMRLVEIDPYSIGRAHDDLRLDLDSGWSV